MDLKKENIKVIKLSLTNDKIDVSILNKYEKTGGFIIEKTALYYTVELENLESIKVLLTNNKIDANILNTNDQKCRISREKHSNNTALHTAVLKDNIDIIQTLIKIDFSIKDDYKRIDIKFYWRKPIDYNIDTQIISLLQP